MSAVRLYFDEAGRIKEVYRPPIFATSKKVDKIEAYTDFDNKDYLVSIAFRRSDGILLGSYPMNPKIDVNGKTYHEYELDYDDTRVPGPLQMTIRYEVMQLDQITGELVAVHSKPLAMTEIYIYESVDDAMDKLSILYKKMNVIQKEIDELKDGIGKASCEIPMSKEKPTNTNSAYWFEIID